MLLLEVGAYYLGEFAFGNNLRVNRPSRNILFDEKMGGTVHMALGASYPETGGLNQSSLHWDMICDLRTAGEVWVDGVLFLKDGPGGDLKYLFATLVNCLLQGSVPLRPSMAP